MPLSGKRIAVIGGCGHVGLPLGIKFALAGAKTTLVDIDAQAVATVNSGRFPFLEHGGEAQLALALKNGLEACTDTSLARNSDVVVFVIGTPVDEHLNPKLSDVLRVFDYYKQYFQEDTLVIMRSTLFPGTMEHLRHRVRELGSSVRLAFCPERVAQGFALDEIDSLPQIVAAFDDLSFKAAYEVFSELAPEIVRLTPLEAELTKLMANSWRYVEFAIANQFYLIAEKNGIDFRRIYDAIRYKYPRASGYKSPGFAAGPCLFKDTMQLASFFEHQFYLGHSAMLVNENLANYAAEKLQSLLGGDLWAKQIGLLGMTFKANNDDTRESLSFKVKKALEFRGAKVLWHDPYLQGSTELGELINKSAGIILCTPHREYLELSLKQPVVDIWGIYSKSTLEVLPGRGQSER